MQLTNWKMNGSLADNAKLLTALRQGIGSTACEVAVCAPFPYLAQVAAALADSPISWGAQDLSMHASGAYTGEVSGGMLADFQCRWVLVGHSERRSLHGETDQQIANKARAALAAGLTPVVCVGESLQAREAGRTQQVIDQQLAPVLALGAEAVSRMVIAYEPVWAIGTGQTAAPEEAQAVHAAIRTKLHALGVPHVRILHGGSVKSSNAARLFAMPDVDGGLIGGAALNPDEFLRIAA